MTANDSTPSEGESADGSTESQDSVAVNNVKNMMHTDIVQYADRETDATASEVAAVLREYADALETDGFERFRPGL
jgi:hypothetical protein